METPTSKELTPLLINILNKVKKSGTIPGKNTHIPAGIYAQTAGNCWYYSTLTADFCNNGIRRNPSQIAQFEKTINLFGINTEIGNNPRIGLTMYDFRAEKILCEGERDVYEYVLPTNPNDKEQLGKMLLPVAQNLKNGRCMVYSRTSSDDIKKDIKDNLILDNEKYANNEAWHAACCGLNVENKNLREYGSYFGKYYNEFEFNLEKFVKMIYNKNLRGSFYFLIQP